MPCDGEADADHDGSECSPEVVGAVPRVSLKAPSSGLRLYDAVYDILSTLCRVRRLV